MTLENLPPDLRWKGYQRWQGSVNTPTFLARGAAIQSNASWTDRHVPRQTGPDPSYLYRGRTESLSVLLSSFTAVGTCDYCIKSFNFSLSSRPIITYSTCQTNLPVKSSSYRRNQPASLFNLTSALSPPALTPSGYSVTLGST